MTCLTLTGLLMVSLIGKNIPVDSDYEMQAATDRPGALYSLNEPAEFTIVLSERGHPATGQTVTVTLSKEGTEDIFQQSFEYDGQPLTVTNTLGSPGFIQCTATCQLPGGSNLYAKIGAGFDPQDIQVDLAPPDDFDTFWADQIAQLDQVPINAQLVPVESGNPDIELFDVTLDCLGGKPVRGYFARPTNAAPGSLPALLTLHGAGVRSADKSGPLARAAEGIMAMDINAHGIENGMPDSYYEDLAAGELSGYAYFGMDSRETIYFRGMFLRLYRALEFLMAQQQWDGKVLGAWGSSQGGGQALAAAGLCTNVNVFGASVPALCNHNGLINGWPRFWRPELGQTPSADVYQAVRYVDAAHFAARTDARAMLAVGFIDNTCRPTTVYTAYNNLTGQKEILTFPEMGHEYRTEIFGRFMEIFREEVEKTKPELAVYEGFDYAPGQDLSHSTTGGTGWAETTVGDYEPGYSATSDSDPTTVTVTSGSLTAPAGCAAPTGNSITIGGAVADASRVLGDRSGVVYVGENGAGFYFSYLFRTSSSGAYAGVRFNSPTSGGSAGEEVSHSPALRASVGSSIAYSSGRIPETDTTYLVVGRCWNDNGIIRIDGSFFEDGDALVEPATWMVTASEPYSSQNAGLVEIIGKPDTPGVMMDELRIGKTFDSVVF